MSIIPTNDNAPISDTSTLVDRLRKHADFANKAVRDLLLEASERIQFLTKERDYYELKMTFYAKDVQREFDRSVKTSNNNCNPVEFHGFK
jgi:hypothetical protein